MVRGGRERLNDKMVPLHDTECVVVLRQASSERLHIIISYDSGIADGTVATYIS